MKKPFILVVNDDGIFAPGIRALIDVVKTLGEVVVVAPDKPQSAQGHALSIKEPIRINRDKKNFPDIEAYECSGTPVDCVKLAKFLIFKDRKIDLCVSGINHGSNASINILYSGTMSAAMEASLEGIPSVGFSLDHFSFDADFEPCKPFVLEVCQFMLEHKTLKTKLLNVNIPRLPLEKIKGLKVCRQAQGQWVEKFLENKDPFGRPYYWLTGEFHNLEKDATDTDLWAVDNGYVAVVPCYHDLTSYKGVKELTKLGM
ncbi:MAG: 5'/3'-nucleotidase SurE [Saprospiraceae bacterium]|nr:5'/3'-nucleotidase SurE [Saprospiraceae bacterium]